MGIHGLLELILLAVPAEHDNQYVSVLFMEEGVRTVKVDVLRLAAGIHLLDGSFSAGRAAVRPCCRAARALVALTPAPPAPVPRGPRNQQLRPAMRASDVA